MDKQILKTLFNIIKSYADGEDWIVISIKEIDNKYIYDNKNAQVQIISTLSNDVMKTLFSDLAKPDQTIKPTKKSK